MAQGVIERSRAAFADIESDSGAGYEGDGAIHGAHDCIETVGVAEAALLLHVVIFLMPTYFKRAVEQCKKFDTGGKYRYYCLP